MLVDGEPQRDVLVTFHPTKVDPEYTMQPHALTKDDGSFALSTYEQGDGVPEGSYDVTITWKAYNAIANNYVGPDKLKGKYEEPATSGLHTNVVPEMPELKFEVTTGERR